MRRLVLMLVVWLPLIVFGCDASKPTSAPPRPVPLDVGWMVFTRDHGMACVYTGKRVRVRLDKEEYAVVVNGDTVELRVWAGDRSVPPVLRFCGTGPAPSGHITVTGTCGEPIRDGIWRSPRVDYMVVVDECVWAAR